MNAKKNMSICFIKTIALFLVFVLHQISFVTGWNEYIIGGMKSFLVTELALLAHTCVPLFFMCTGINLRKRTMSWKTHYIKIYKILLPYFAAAMVCQLYYARFRGGIEWQGFLKFTAAPYGWYVKYYCVLYLFVPLLNILFKHMHHKEIWLIFLAVVTTLGACGRYQNVVENNMILLYLFKMLKNLFPVVYYWLGQYVYSKIDKILQIPLKGYTILLLGFLAGNGIFLYGKYYGTNVYFIPNGYGTLNIVLISLFLFIILYKTDLKVKENGWIDRISGVTLEAYLLSSISDNFICRLTEGSYRYSPWYLMVAGTLGTAIFSILAGMAIHEIFDKIYTILGKKRVLRENQNGAKDTY